MKGRGISILFCTCCLIGIVFFVIKQGSLRPQPTTTNLMPTNASSTMKLASRAFSEGARIPVKYTCDGNETSIPLTISGVPGNAVSLAIFLEDPDTSMGTFTHWVVFNISPDTTDVAEEMPKTSPTFGTAGQNGAGTTDYLGPCPPTGTHRYIFTLYALDETLPLAVGATKEQVIAAMNGHTIATSRLMGTYGRK